MIELAEMKKEDIARCAEIYFTAFGYDKTFAKLDDIAADDPELAGVFKKSYNFEPYFEKCVEQEGKYALCLKDNSETVGFITAWDIPCPDSGDAIHIDTIAVAPECQRKGYGTKIIEMFIQTISKEKLVVLDTKKDKPAFALYKKLGFVETEVISMQKSPLLDRLEAEIKEQKAELKKIMAEKGELERMQEQLKKSGIDL